uniref:Uncharacterized protein n=1 Tax=Tetranychus urticae TaxID=32264 RepID=T1JZ03_TETUR
MPLDNTPRCFMVLHWLPYFKPDGIATIIQFQFLFLFR